ncbi:MAG TPA: hypothetical protein VMF65_01335 [Acidimicrobiales bacterium]|nr:hypothetical protein [Acidimicrobiales bacterium]
MGASRPVRRGPHLPESGSAVVPGALAIAILLVVFIGALNFVLDEYAKGAIRTAVDEAAQAGATAGGSLAVCEAEATQVRRNLLPGPFGDGISVTCAQQGGEMVSSATGSLPSLLPLVPAIHASLVGISIITEAPAQ